MYDPDTQSLLGVVDQPLADIVRSYASGGGLGPNAKGGDKGEEWLTLTLPSAHGATKQATETTDDALGEEEEDEQRERRGAEGEDQDEVDGERSEAEVGRHATDRGPINQRVNERTDSNNNNTATVPKVASRGSRGTATKVAASASSTVADTVAGTTESSRQVKVRVRLRLNTHLELLDPEFSFCGFHGAIAATTALSNGSGLSMCPLRTDGPNGPNGTERGLNGVSKLVRRLARACAVWTRPSLAQWAELDLIEDAERRAVPGEGLFALDGIGTGAGDDTDDDTSTDGAGTTSPWLRRRRRREKGRWKRMFVPNMVQKKLDFVAQTKKKMAKMQSTIVDYCNLSEQWTHLMDWTQPEKTAVAASVVSLFFITALIIPSDILLMVIAVATGLQGYVGRKAATRRHSEWHNKRAAAIAKAAAARGKGRGKGKKDALSEEYPTKRTPGVMYRAFLNILDTLPRDSDLEAIYAERRAAHQRLRSAVQRRVWLQADWAGELDVWCLPSHAVSMSNATGGGVARGVARRQRRRIRRLLNRGRRESFNAEGNGLLVPASVGPVRDDRGKVANEPTKPEEGGQLYSGYSGLRRRAGPTFEQAAVTAAGGGSGSGGGGGGGGDDWGASVVEGAGSSNMNEGGYPGEGDRSDVDRTVEGAGEWRRCFGAIRRGSLEVWLSTGALGEQDGEEGDGEPPADLQVPLAGRALQFTATSGRGPAVRDISMAALVVVEVEGEEEDVYVAVEGTTLGAFGQAFAAAEYR